MTDSAREELRIEVGRAISRPTKRIGPVMFSDQLDAVMAVIDRVVRAYRLHERETLIQLAIRHLDENLDIAHDKETGDGKIMFVGPAAEAAVDAILASLREPIPAYVIESLTYIADNSGERDIRAATRPDWCQGADAVCHHPACACVIAAASPVTATIPPHAGTNNPNWYQDSEAIECQQCGHMYAFPEIKS